MLGVFQCVVAMRIFGGEEQLMARREGSVWSLWQVLFSFVGKDLVTLPEIVFSAMLFAMTFWPLSGIFVTGNDYVALGFAVIYCFWGMNHIWAITLHRQIGMLLAVVVPFSCFLCTGIASGGFSAHSLGGLGGLFMLASPSRWGLLYLITRHALGPGSTVQGDAGAGEVRKHWAARSLDVDRIQCPDYSGTVLERWRDGRSHVCHTGQLLLLGFLYRFLAVACLLIVSSSRASGGQLPLGITSRIKARILRDAIFTFLVFFFWFEVALLGHTH